MKPEVPSPAGFGVGDVNFPRTRLLCDGCPPLGWVGWISNTRTRLNENFGTPIGVTCLNINKDNKIRPI